MKNARFFVLFFAALAISATALSGTAQADNSETMGTQGGGWQNQQQGWGNQGRQYNAAPQGFQCPAGWSCGPKAQKKKEEDGCTSRFSRCFRNKNGGGGGGGDGGDD